MNTKRQDSVRYRANSLASIASDTRYSTMIRQASDLILDLAAEVDAMAAELAKWRQKYMSSSESWPDTIPYDESEPGGWPKSIPVVEPFQD